MQRLEAQRNLTKLQALRLQRGSAVGSLANPLFDPGADSFLLMTACCEFIHGGLERLETFAEDRYVQERFEEILGGTGFGIERPCETSLPNANQLPEKLRKTLGIRQIK